MDNPEVNGTNGTSQMQDINYLNILQQEHVERLYNILINISSSFYYDLTDTGGGKTYNSGKLFQLLTYTFPGFRWKLFVICTKPSRSVWTDMCEEYGIPYEIYTYSKISGRFLPKKDIFSIKHNFLTAETEGKKVIYSYTEEWVEKVSGNNRMLLVFDESRALKNSGTHINLSCKKLIEALTIQRLSNRSRFGFLSATLLEKKIHYESFLKVCNITNKPLSTTESSRNVTNHCLLLDRHNTLRITSQYPPPLKRSVRREMVNKLFIEVILQQCCSGMPMDIQCRKYRGYFNITREEDILGIENASKLMISAVNRDSENFILKEGGLGNISIGLSMINIYNNSKNKIKKSINLHDTDIETERIRYVFISPGYKTSLAHQASGRVFRLGVTSLGRSYIFYPKNVSIPINILNSMIDKSRVTKTTYSDNQNIMLPGNYPIYIEDEGYIVDEDNITNREYNLFTYPNEESVLNRKNIYDQIENG